MSESSGENRPLRGPFPIVAPSNSTLLGIHLAEYQALTNRITYWISIQYVVYSATAVVLTLIIQTWGSKNISNSMIAWGGLLLIQLMAWVWLYAVYEIHNTAVYLEGELKQKVCDIAGTSSLWGWEPYLAGQRTSGFTKFEWTQSISVLALAGLLAASGLIWKVEPNPKEVRHYIVWLVFNAFVFMMIVLKRRDSRRLQEKLANLAKTGLKADDGKQ